MRKLQPFFSFILKQKISLPFLPSLGIEVTYHLPDVLGERDGKLFDSKFCLQTVTFSESNFCAISRKIYGKSYLLKIQSNI